MTLQEVENYYGEKSYSYIFEALSIIEDTFEFSINKDDRILCITCVNEDGYKLYIRNTMIGEYTFLISFKDGNKKDNDEKVFKDEESASRYIQELFGVEISYGYY